MLLALDFDKLLITTIIGLSTGAIYAVIASGLVVTYTTSGIFNLAHGATGVLAAFVYWQLRFDWGWPAPIAIVLVLFVLCPLFGAMTERYLMRGLRDTSEVVRLAVTVALFVAVLGLVSWIWPSGKVRAMRRFYDGNSVSLGGINVSWHKLITLACAIVVALGLRVLMYRSRTGVAMRAVVDDRNLAELNGARPHRVAMASWALGAMLAGLAGILLAGEQGLNVEPLTLLVINAYAAAIIGRLRSLPWTFAGAVLLGLLDSFYLGYSGPKTWIPQSFFGFSLTGLRASIPTLVLFIALIAMPQARLRVGVVKIREKHKEPAWSTALLGAGILIGFIVAVSGMLSRGDQITLQTALLMSIAALSLVPLTGYAGQMTLAPLTFAGLGALAMNKLPGGGNLLTLIAAMLIIAVVGALIALPALRVTGIYLALTTTAFAVLVTNLVFNQKQAFGSTGNVRVPALDLPGLDLKSPRARLIVAAVAFSILGLGVVAIRRSRLGRRLIALKDSPAAAATLGMNTTAAKVVAFAISAAIAACAGALAGDQVSAQRYDFLQSLPVVLLAVLGGVAAVSGALFGGVMLSGNTVLSGIAGSKFVRDLTKILPGTMGMTLGRQPAGVAEQTSEGYRTLLGRWGLIAVAVGGGVVLWMLTTFGAVSHWSFVFAIVIWSMGVVPLLASLADLRSPSTNLLIGFLAVAVAVAAFVDWGDVLPSSGWRLVVLIGMMVILLQVAGRLLAKAGAGRDQGEKH